MTTSGWLATFAVVVLAIVLAASGYRALLRARRQLASEHREMTVLQTRLDAAAITSGGWLYTVDTESRFIYCSEASEACLGYLPEELLGTQASELLSPDEAAMLDTRATDLPEQVNTIVVRGRHRNGEDRWFEVTITPLVDPADDRILGWTGTARPLTEAKHPAIFREIHRRSVAEILRTDGLSIAFQPIVDLTSCRIVGVEALSRFPSRTSVTPDVVFAEAADSGLDAELELLAIRRALIEAEILDPSLYVAVNVSPRVLALAAFMETLRASSIALNRIVVEITEHVSVADYSVLEGPRRELREAGVQLAIDDAGSGYASLRHIVTLAPEIIKIDRGLVTEVNCDRARRALVAAVVSFASEMGATRIVGEGVETAAELQALTDLGVDSAQGYFLGRPSVERAEWVGWGRAVVPAT